MFKPLTDLTRLEQYPWTITMNHRNLVNVNPLIKKNLDATYPGPYDHVVIAQIDEEGTEVALVAGSKADEGALHLVSSKSGGTARFSFTLLVTKFPGLRVGRGRVRVFKVGTRDEGSKRILVINLVDTEVQVPEVIQNRRRARGRAQSKSLQGEAPKKEDPSAQPPDQEEK